MIQLKTFVFNPLQVNTYLLYDENGHTIIIDAACQSSNEKAELKHFVDNNKLQVNYLINTHLHFDHVFGNRFVKAQYNIGPLAHKNDEFLYQESIADMMGFPVDEPFEPLAGYLEEGQFIKTGRIELEVIHIEGHSPGGLALYEPGMQWLFSGDILFAQSIGRSDLMGGDYQKLVEGIKTKLYRLSDHVKVFPGHGPSTTIGHEKKYNPFTGG